MNRHEIARLWLATPNGQRWGQDQIESLLGKNPTLERCSDSEVNEALARASTPAELALLLAEKDVLIRGRVTFEGVAVEVDSGSSPWRARTFSFSEAADHLGFRVAEVVDHWVVIHRNPSVPELVSSFELLLIDIRVWLNRFHKTWTDQIVRELLQSPPAGEDWVITRNSAGVTVRALPLVFPPGAQGPRMVYDPIELIGRMLGEPNAVS